LIRSNSSTIAKAKREVVDGPELVDFQPNRLTASEFVQQVALKKIEIASQSRTQLPADVVDDPFAGSPLL
jgi:hypothetical protein